MLFPQLEQCDSTDFIPSDVFPADSGNHIDSVVIVVKALFRLYLSSMVLPPYEATTMMVEEDKTIWILEKSKYLHLYKDLNSRQFMRLFIETSMFSVFYLHYFQWKSFVCLKSIRFMLTTDDTLYRE